MLHPIWERFILRRHKLGRGSQTFSGHAPLQHLGRWARTPKHGRRKDFFQTRAKSEFSRGSRVGGRGSGGESAPPNVSICWNPWKSGQKWRPTWFDFKKWCPTFAEKHMNLVFGGQTKNGFFRRQNLLAKVTQNFSDNFGVFGQKSFARPNFCLLLHLCAGVGQKYVFRGKKLHFHHSKPRKQLFLQKIWWENVKFQNPGGLALPSDAHASKTFYNKNAEENNKNIFTNKHIMNFENNSHWYFLYFNLWTRHEVHRAQAHTICTTHIDNNRHRTFCNGVGGRSTGLQTLVS